METKSEKLFRDFCRTAKWYVWRVRTRDTEARRRPDFTVWRWFRRLAVEVKQIDPNPNDREQARALDAGGIALIGGEPGRRLRDHLKDGAAQLKALTRGRWPGALVLFDNTALASYVDEYHIKVAMHGLEQLVLERGATGAAPSRLIGYRTGGKRRLTDKTGTAVSVVCRLRRGGTGEPHLDMFHNEHAAAPLNHRYWRAANLRHFRLSPTVDGQPREWVEVTNAG